MKHLFNKEDLLDRLRAWDSFLKRKVRLIACGGTALTLLGIKESTKDIDLLVPDLGEYEYLISTLKQLGFKPVTGSGWSRGDGFIFELFRGKAVHTTELLESPADEGNHILVKELAYIYLGMLNYYDIIISKLFRASSVDIEDCLLLIREKKQEIDINRLIERFHETAAFDVSEEKVNKNLENFLRLIKKKDN